MSNVSFIGLGGMSHAIATRAITGGNTVEVIGRNAAKANAFAAELSDQVAVGAFGEVPSGDLVVLAVPHASAQEVVAQYGNALAGKVIIDISNTFDAALDLTTPDGTSGAEEIARWLPADTAVVKAFNTVFGHVLALGGSFDVPFAGDDERAKTVVSAFIASLGLRPLDAGGLKMARYLESVGPLLMGLAQHGVGSFNLALKVDVVS